MKPIYQLSKSWRENATDGPVFDWEDGFPDRPDGPPADEWRDFLGHRVRSPIGVPAGPLLNSQWIKLAAQLGYDIPWYKTIRTSPSDGHPPPNVVLIDSDEVRRNLPVLHALPPDAALPSSVDDLAITNSFGMPAFDRKYLQDDIRKANAALGEGQVMVVSVVGTPPPASSGGGDSSVSCTPAQQQALFVRDFVDAALMAQEAGAKLIEANFSCPNVGPSAEGSIFLSPTSVKDIASHLTAALTVPLLIKVGVYRDAPLSGSMLLQETAAGGVPDTMRKVFEAARDAGVRAVSGINTLSREVLDSQGTGPVLGPGRVRSGVCGGPIRPHAHTWLHDARALMAGDSSLAGSLKLTVCGGLTAPAHFDEFLDLGSDVVASATGMMFNPLLANEWHLLQQQKV